MANLPDPSLLCKHPEPGLLPSTGVNRLHGYCEPLRLSRPPDPHGRVGVASAHDRGSPVLRHHPSRRAVSTTPADSPGSGGCLEPDSAAFPVIRAGRRPLQSFGACSEFARVTARRVAARLLEPLSGGFSRGGYPPRP